MKTALSSTLPLAALLAALSGMLPAMPAAAADLPTPGAAAPDPQRAARAPVGPVMDAMQSALREMQAAQDARLPLPAQLDRLAELRYTPETAAKLRAVFGNEQPLRFEKAAARPGRLLYRMRLQPLHYIGADKVRVDWDAALTEAEMDKAGKAVDFKGRWNAIGVEEPTFRLGAEGITLAGRQTLGADRLWFGSGQLRIGRVRGGSPQSPHAGADVTLNDLRMDWKVSERRKTVDMQFQQRIASIAAAGDRVEDLRFDMRIVNVDRAAMVALRDAGERQREQVKGMTPEQQLAAMRPLLQGFGKSVILRGSAIEIDEISARFHGHKASIRGRVGLQGAVEDDMKDAGALFKKMLARFEVRVPVALVREVSGIVAARQVQEQQQQQAGAGNGMGVDQLAQSMTDIVVGKLLGGGYARLEDGVLVSTLEVRNGKLSANGKEITLPDAGRQDKGGQSPAAVQRSNLPAGALQARRIEESCRLPDYPAEVVRQDQPLRASFAYRVDTEGKVHGARIEQASGFADWDQAALAALGRCRYVPALQEGKPIDLQMTWSLVREAGTGRPRDPNPAP